MSQIEKPFITLGITSSGIVYACSGIDKRYPSLQDAIDNHGKDKNEIISDHSFIGRDTSRWFIAQLIVESKVLQKETHTFENLALPAPPLAPRALNLEDSSRHEEIQF